MDWIGKTSSSHVYFILRIYIKKLIFNCVNYFFQPLVATMKLMTGNP
jgi:hypothetical protein